MYFRKKVDLSTFTQALDAFNTLVVPFVTERSLSLHEAFEVSRLENPVVYSILSYLWSTQPGRAYLRGCFASGFRFTDVNREGHPPVD